ncbi:MAG: hypothetical protein AB7T63_08755 [Planctomycetota bacterium]
MKILVSFAGAIGRHGGRWRARQRHLGRSARRHGFDAVRPWTRRRLKRTAFYREHATLLETPRGAGLWAWKPYIILETLLEAPADAWVVYWDVGRGRRGARRRGHAFRAPIAALLDWCGSCNGGLLPGVYIPEFGPNRLWTKRDCFVGMGCDEPRFWEHPQIQATFSVWRRTPVALDLLHEWLACCTDPRLIGDGPSTCGLPDLDGFVEHRHDQSILTNLVIRGGLRCYGRPEVSTPDAKDLNALTARIERDRESGTRPDSSLSL